MTQEPTISLTAMRNDGSRIRVDIQILNDHPAEILATLPNRSDTVSGIDFFDCLLKLRSNLESDNYLLCCQGARRDSTPSGMTRQMSNGRLVYALRSGMPTSEDDLVDIFAPAPCDEVTTIDDQKARSLKFMRENWTKKGPT